MSYLGSWQTCEIVKIIWEQGYLTAPSAFSSFLQPRDCWFPQRLLVLTEIFSRLPYSWDKCCGNRASINAKDCLSYQYYTMFFEECSSDFCKPLVNFQVYSQLNLSAFFISFFGQCLYCFCEGVFLQSFRNVSLTNAPRIAANLLLVSRVWEMFILTFFFGTFLTHFMEKNILLGSDSTIFANVLALTSLINFLTLTHS